ncbi:M23 family peptidase, partial [Streptomyces sp. NPDC126497]
MFQRVTSRLSFTSPARTRAAVLAAGMGATVVLGVGAATAAENTAAPAASVQQQASWVDPVKSYRLSASFAQNGGMWAHKHSGQDYAVPTGTTVMA